MVLAPFLNSIGFFKLLKSRRIYFAHSKLIFKFTTTSSSVVKGAQQVKKKTPLQLPEQRVAGK